MSEKKSIRIPVSSGDKVINVELKNDIDFLEILSLKFTQSDVYSSGLCSDYGVVVGRVTANNGLGIPNAKVSIFIPLNNEDEIDPIISALYPYKETTDKNDNGYRYNLLPKRKQHGGHNPTGTFFDQEDILTNEEYLEVFEKYYNYTAKTNDSGDFMIWGVPVGTQTVHIDIDLSDIGCFSLRPYDFIRKGMGKDRFEREYSFKSSSDIDGLPQIVEFEKTIEVYPFIGNEELCEIGISRVDYDLTEADIKIEPVSLILVSTVTDDNSTAMKQNGKIFKNSGYKCSLQTKEGTIESVRFTGGKVYGSDGTLYPELEYFNISETIDQNGVAMVVLPMNIDYVYTNQFGEQEITSDKNKGIPTKCISRFRFSLNDGGGKKTTAKYLVPNIREFNSNNNGRNDKTSERYSGEYDRLMILSYMFSNVYEDYLDLPKSYSGITFGSPYQYSVTESIKSYKNSLILNVDEQTNELVPLDYFYKFTYGKVYTVSSFQGSHYDENTSLQKKSFIGSLGKKFIPFLGIKEIRPNVEEDCASNVNYFPVNYGFKNNYKISLIISEILLFLQFIFYTVSIFVYEKLGSFLLGLGLTIGKAGDFLGSGDLKSASDNLVDVAVSLQEAGQTILSLTTYPDCEECTTDIDNSGGVSNVSLNAYCRSSEFKTRIVTYTGNTDPQYNGVFLVYDSSSWYKTSESSGSTMLPELFPGEPNKDDCADNLYEWQLPYFVRLLTTNGGNDPKFIGEVYYEYNNNWESYQTTFGTGITYNLIDSDLETNKYQVGNYNINYRDRVILSSNGSQYNYIVKYLDENGNVSTPPEMIVIDLTTVEVSNNTRRDLTVVIGPEASTATYSGKTLGWVNNVFAAEKSDAIRYSIEDWNSFIGNQLVMNEGVLNNTFVYTRMYDMTNTKSDYGFAVSIEQGCEKYDKFYDEQGHFMTYIWSKNNADYNANGPAYPSSHEVSFYKGGWGGWDDSNVKNALIPNYTNTNYRESVLSPGLGYSIIASVAGKTNSTFRMPSLARGNSHGGYIAYNKKTKSGLTEVRDGVFTIVPVIRGTSLNQSVIKEWYRRKRIGMVFCAGVINYTFIDNWLNGMLYFFKFGKKIHWDDKEKYDIGQRSSKFPRSLIFFNILDENFYYRSTPFNPVTQKFTGQILASSYHELLHPTTFYDVGVRDEFFYEICSDPTLDPTCSVIRDISSTSYQDPANIIEYGLSYKLDIDGATSDIKDFFINSDFDNELSILNGDLIQLISINSESGIEEFDLDSPKYFMYNNEVLDPEDPSTIDYFKGGTNNYGPLPIDFKLDENGSFIRGCLNSRLGDYSQPVPFYLWDKKGTGFGSYSDKKISQAWDRSSIAIMKLQRIFSVSNTLSTTTNYLMNDGEEEYLLMPPTITHNSFVVTGNTTDSIERFDNITMSSDTPSFVINQTVNGASGYTEHETWLSVTSGTIKDPIVGNIYIIVNKTWKLQSIQYKKDVNETFIFETTQNYSGNKQVLSTPFMFYFGLRPQKTALDLLIKYYGPKGAFPVTD